MTDNGIGVEGAKAMSEMLKTNTTLKELGLSGEKERKERERKEERMTGNLIKVEGAKAMSEMLKVNTSLKELNLCGEEERERERERKEESMTENEIGYGGRNMVEDTWGIRGGKLYI